MEDDSGSYCCFAAFFPKVSSKEGGRPKAPEMFWKMSECATGLLDYIKDWLELEKWVM